jgi:hypothetical protein
MLKGRVPRRVGDNQRDEGAGHQQDATGSLNVQKPFDRVKQPVDRSDRQK